MIDKVIHNSDYSIPFLPSNPPKSSTLDFSLDVFGGAHRHITWPSSTRKSKWTLWWGLFDPQIMSASIAASTFSDMQTNKQQQQQQQQKGGMLTIYFIEPLKEGTLAHSLKWKNKIKSENTQNIQYSVKLKWVTDSHRLALGVISWHVQLPYWISRHFLTLLRHFILLLWFCVQCDITVN